MLGRRRTLDTERPSRGRGRVASSSRFERELARSCASSSELRRDPRRAAPDPRPHQAVVETALALARQPALIPAREPGLYRLPALTGAWARCPTARAPVHRRDPTARRSTRRLRPRRRRALPPRPPLVQMSLRLLARRGLAARIERSAGSNASPRASSTTLACATRWSVVYARLVVTGADGHRLHEEVIQAGGFIREGRSSGSASPRSRSCWRFQQPAVRPRPIRRASARTPSSTRGAAPLARRRRARQGAHRRASSGSSSERRDEEVAKITAVLTELRDQILAELDASPPPTARALRRRRARAARAQPRLTSAHRADEIPAEIEARDRGAAAPVRRSRAARVPGRRRVPRPARSRRR